MKRLFMSGWGQFGKQVIDALQQENQLNYGAEYSANTPVDEGIVRNMEKDTVLRCWQRKILSRN